MGRELRGGAIPEPRPFPAPPAGALHDGSCSSEWTAEIFPDFRYFFCYVLLRFHFFLRFGLRARAAPKVTCMDTGRGHKHGAQRARVHV